MHCLSESGGKRFSDLRKMADPFFGRLGGAAIEPVIQSLPDSLLDEIQKSGTCDSVSQFCGHYTIGVMSVYRFRSDSGIGFDRDRHSVQVAI